MNLKHKFTQVIIDDIIDLGMNPEEFDAEALQMYINHYMHHAYGCLIPSESIQTSCIKSRAKLFRLSSEVPGVYKFHQFTPQGIIGTYTIGEITVPVKIGFETDEPNNRILWKRVLSVKHTNPSNEEMTEFGTEMVKFLCIMQGKHVPTVVEAGKNINVFVEGFEEPFVLDNVKSSRRDMGERYGDARVIQD